MKMSADEFKDYVGSLISYVGFDFQGKDCGVDPLSLNDFEMKCGDDFMTARSIDEVMTTCFFDGHSLNEICDLVDFGS